MENINWREKIPENILKQMIAEKIDIHYERPSFFDTVAEMIISVSKRSTCLFYNVAAAIYRDNQVISLGYNGSSSGDVHCTKVGCARIVDGEIKKGAGLCRGGHAEINAISNAAKNGINISNSGLMISFRPCFSCSKQIVNTGIKEVSYLFDYDGENNVEPYLRRLGINIIKYDSAYLDRWFKNLKGGE